MKIPLSSAHVVVSGRVQGVGFRAFVQEQAHCLGLTGWVRNLPNGNVESYVEGERSVIETWVRHLEKGPPLSRVESCNVEWRQPENLHTSFSIIS